MGVDRAAEVQRLNLADSHIVNAEKNITAQQIILEKLRVDGHDTHEAEHTLKEMQGLLSGFQEHRQLIVEMIAQIDAGLT